MIDLRTKCSASEYVICLSETICFACQDMSSLVFCDHIQKCMPGEVGITFAFI